MTATKGPWKAVVDNKEVVATVENSRGYILAYLDCGQITVAQNVDNALLMAAAPVMFECLEILSKQPSYDLVATKRHVESVLIKAKGGKRG